MKILKMRKRIKNKDEDDDDDDWQKWQTKHHPPPCVSSPCFPILLAAQLQTQTWLAQHLMLSANEIPGVVSPKAIPKTLNPLRLRSVKWHFFPHFFPTVDLEWKHGFIMIYPYWRKQGWQEVQNQMSVFVKKTILIYACKQVVESNQNP